MTSRDAMVKQAATAPQKKEVNRRGDGEGFRSRFAEISAGDVTIRNGSSASDPPGQLIFSKPNDGC
jgi:hypothetical protein